VDTEHQFGGVQFLGFEHITLVPFQRNMLLHELLSKAEHEWVDNYHKECLLKVQMMMMMMMMMRISPFGQLGLWVPSFGGRDVYTSSTYAYSYPCQ
jgi:hypothetical protein